MRIDILALGSRGDVQPYMALGLGLQAAGHRVRLVTLSGFEEFVRSYGLDHVAVAPSPQAIAATVDGKDWIKQRENVIGFVRGFLRVARAVVEEGIANYWRVCQDVEALVAAPSGIPLAVHVAEKLSLPLVRANLAPSVPTRYDWDGKTSRMIAARTAWDALAGATVRLLFWEGLRRRTNRARRDVLDLPPLRLQEPWAMLDRQRIPLLDGYSPAVVNPPPDWGDWIHVTGYWLMPDAGGWVPPAELSDFLASGPPPVFVGFGSTPFPAADAATQAVIQALERTRKRAIIVAGTSGLPTGRLTDDVLSVDSVPHGWLFPRVAAAVHHGGAGVTGAALRAGLPSVVVPVFADQPFWGRRVFELGVGPRPIPARQLSSDALAHALGEVTRDDRMRARAAGIGARIRSEDGIARAVETFDQYVRTINALEPACQRSTLTT
ncbi:MAG: glycosyltransferase [Vicinamibacterales bacterium]